MLNDQFVQSEVEYLRQRRLSAAAEYRTAKSAARVRSLRQRLTGAVEQLVSGRTHRDRTAHAA